LRGSFYWLSAAEIPARGVLTVTIPAEELVEPSWVGLKRKFLYRAGALRALPISRKHLTLEVTASHAAIVAFECH
jgi:hypothetical protein